MSKHPEDDQRHESDLQECIDRIKQLEVALRESTELLQDVLNVGCSIPMAFLQRQVAANETVLKGGGV